MSLDGLIEKENILHQLQPDANFAGICMHLQSLHGIIHLAFPISPVCLRNITYHLLSPNNNFGTNCC